MTVSSTRPRLILVNGAWVGPWEFAPIVPILEADGWEVDAIALPSIGSTEGLAADAAAVTAAIERADGPVVLVAHSYGGTPVTQAGDHPSVERIVYVTAFAADAGESLLDIMGGTQPEWWGVADGQVTMGRTRDERVERLPPTCRREFRVKPRSSSPTCSDRSRSTRSRPRSRRPRGRVARQPTS